MDQLQELITNIDNSFNWADEVEEELAGTAGHEEFSIQFDKPHEDDIQSENVRSDLTPPQVESTAVENESTSSTAHPQTTPSPEPQPSARNSGIMQSRWANAPDEPAAAVVVVEPNSEVTKDAMSLEQGVHSTPSRNRRGRGINHSKKDSAQSVRSGKSSLSGSPKKSNREGSKQTKPRGTSTQGTESAHITTPLVAAHTSPKVHSISPSKSASSNAVDNDQPSAPAVASDVDKKIDGPVQTPSSSPSKNEISKSRWA